MALAAGLSLEAVRLQLQKSGQEHLVAHLLQAETAATGATVSDKNSDEQQQQQQQQSLLQQIAGIDIPQTVSFFHKAIGATAVPDAAVVKPISSFSLSQADSATKSRMYDLGAKAIAEGKVAAVILSGGQGTRLGFSGPKGMFDVGLPSHKSIFQLHIEKVMRLKSLIGARGYAPIYVMTSDLNDRIIRDFFAENNYFGYPVEDIFFFEQGLQPCFSNEGNILLESEFKVSMAPDGNGGVYMALSASGALKNMVERGVEHVHFYGIDNLLTRSLDPVFIGLCIENNVELGNKVVWRANKSEKVGVTVTDASGRMRILEYSEIPTELAEACDDTGKLIFGAANICNHYLSVSFLRSKVLVNLIDSYHVAKKKIAYFDPQSRQLVTPTANNGVKLEMFIFDVFPLADRHIVMEVDREDEFAPVKNEPGNPVDSPDTARYLLTEQSKRWLQSVDATIVDAHGVSVPVAKIGDACQKLASDGLQCEISSLVSYGGEQLAEAYASKTVTLPVYIDHK